MKHWLMKSEPDVYGIEDLKRDGSTCWEGIRNYTARNFMRDDMKVGDLVLFYHSQARPPGVAGIARVCREGYPDPYAFDPDSRYFDKKSKPKMPTWMMVDIEWVETFPRLISLQELKDDKALEDMLVVRKGQRLSIQPVEPQHYAHIVALAKKPA